MLSDQTINAEFLANEVKNWKQFAVLPGYMLFRASAVPCTAALYNTLDITASNIGGFRLID